MANTISLSPKPGIKCYAWNNRFCNTCSYTTTLKKVNQSSEVEWLLTDESAQCICSHHVSQHCTVRDHSGLVLVTVMAKIAESICTVIVGSLEHVA